MAHELGPHHERGVSWVGLVDDVLFHNMAWSRSHHHHPVGEKNSLMDGVSDKDDGELFLSPKRQKISIQAVTGDLIFSPNTIISSITFFIESINNS